MSDRPHAEKLRAVEEAYGRAMLRAHGFERALATLAIFKLPRRTVDPEAQALIDGVNNLPLGVLIKRFDRDYQPSRQVIADLLAVLKARNDLTHRVSEAIERACLQEDWDEALLPELERASSLFEVNMPVLREYLSDAYVSVGLDEATILAELRRRFPGMAVDA